MAQRVHSVHRDRCIACGACVAACPAGALELAGYDIGLEELVTAVGRDRAFYKQTGGGVTFSGGEPLLQSEELAEVLSRCHSAELHTAVETCSNVPREAFEAVVENTDLFLCDLKCVSEELHKKVTGTSNALILQNFDWLFRQGKPIWVRIPLIPGINDVKEELGAMARFIRKGGEAIERVELLPYHDLGKSKYAALGCEYVFEKEYGRCENARERAVFAQKVLADCGVESIV